MKKLLSVIFALFFIQFSAIAQEDNAMIVFDASGSMWGQVGGKPKISIAKKALEKVVTDWNEDIHLGFIAYGHRKKGDCNDIQILTPIGEVNRKDLISKVKKIQPKGKTPISRSLKKAAEALKFTEEKATVILISDGKETCDADPCATAKALESKGIDFVAHVIGFAVDKQTGKQLKCIADVTGGEYFSANDASALNAAMGTIVKKVEKVEPPVVKNNKFQLTAAEVEGGKWVKAKHYIYNAVDGEKEGSYIKSCTSTKKKACEYQLPVGSYTIETVYSKKTQWTPFELPAEPFSLNVITGKTGKLDLTATEKEGGKWVKARHYIYKMVDGEKEGSYIVSCTSTKKKGCQYQLPVGSYIIETVYSKKTQWTPFELPAEPFSLNVITGKTGKLDLTATEKEGGKWVKARHYIYKTVDGEKAGSYIVSCTSTKKKGCQYQLPVGSYIIETVYSKKTQWTLFELPVGPFSLNVVTGQTGKVEITASEKEGSRWVNARHWFYKIVDGEKDSNYTESCNSTKKKPCAVQIPEGHYNLHSTFDKFKKNTLIEVTSSGVSKTHVTFAQFFVASICSDMNETITHEIYASSGRLVYEKQAKCSDKLKVPLENGQYTIESKVGNDTKESSFTLGGDNPNQITIDMRKKDTEDKSHKDLIDADKKASSEAMAPKARPKSTKKKAEKTVASQKTISASKEVQAFKKGVLASLAPLKGVKECYESAGDLVQAKLCEDLEEQAFMVAMDAMKGSAKSSQLVKHTEWNDEIKNQTVEKTAKDIKSMELSVKCIDNGAGFYNLEKCIANNGAL